MLKLDLPHSPYLHNLPCRVLRESPHARPERVYARQRAGTGPDGQPVTGPLRAFVVEVLAPEGPYHGWRPLVWETEIRGGLAAVLADLAVREG